MLSVKILKGCACEKGIWHFWILIIRWKRSFRHLALSDISINMKNKISKFSFYLDNPLEVMCSTQILLNTFSFKPAAGGSSVSELFIEPGPRQFKSIYVQMWYLCCYCCPQFHRTTTQSHKLCGRSLSLFYCWRYLDGKSNAL